MRGAAALARPRLRSVEQERELHAAVALNLE